MTRTPEGARDHISGRRLAAFEVRFHAVHQPKCGGIRERGAGTPLDQATGGIPLPESPRVREWRTTADDAASGFDVGTCLDERVDRSDVVAAGRPMQWCLVVRTHEPSVDIRACPGQFSDDRRAVRIMTRPVSRDVQQRALLGAAIVAPEQGVQCRWSISPVVLNPTPQERIEPPSNFFQ
jgi:hypothetical protein